VIAESGEILQHPVEIVPGSRYRIGEIWIGFFDADDAWVDILPAAVAPFVSAPLPEPDAGPVAAFAPEPDAPPMPEILHEPEREHEHESVPAPPPPKDWRERIAYWWKALRDSRSRMAGACVIVLAAVLLLVWVGLLISSAFAGPKVHYQRVAIGDEAAAEATRVAADDKGRPKSREKLAEALKRMLAERELLDRLDMNFDDDVWELRGSLDVDEQGRLERTLAAFNRTYQPPFGIRASVVPVRDMLPFKIVQVTTGKYGSVVTDSGQRLFVGDVLEGYKLVAIDRNKLVFTGKMRIEFAW
jgi:hypothetical protein